MYLCQSVPFCCTPRYQTGYNYDCEVIVSHWRKVYCFRVCQAVTHSVSYYSLYHCLAVTRIIKCHQMLSNSIYNIFHFLHYISCFPFPWLLWNCCYNHQCCLQNQQNENVFWIMKDTLFPFTQNWGLIYWVIQLAQKRGNIPNQAAFQKLLEAFSQNTSKSVQEKTFIH